MSQLGVASVENPPEGATDVMHITTIGVQEDSHGSCNAWHYMGGDSELWKMFGHINDDTRSFIETMKKILPVVDTPTSICVGWTGYWDKVGEITEPRFCQTTDKSGRGMFFVGDSIIMQRYLKGDTLIYYLRDKPWVNNTASKEQIRGWQAALSTFVATNKQDD